MTSIDISGLVGKYVKRLVTSSGPRGFGFDFGYCVVGAIAPSHAECKLILANVRSGDSDYGELCQESLGLVYLMSPAEIQEHGLA